MNKLLIKLILLILFGVCSVFLSAYRDNFTLKPTLQSESHDLTNLDDLKQAFDSQQSNIQVRQSGRIAKILRDDDHTPRHQRFVVALSSGQKILIAHNIELAPRVEGLEQGSTISFYGEYAWNNKGGVVHWTHHDPKGSHRDGWLLYGNRKYD